MNKVLTYSSLTICAALVVFTFLTAKSYEQLAAAIVLYPMLGYFVLKAFPRSREVDMNIPYAPPIATAQTKPEAVNIGKTEVVDVDKRSFLKLVGTMGVAIFISSLLGERVGQILFGKSLMQGANTSPPPPATTTPTSSITEGYKIAEADDGAVSYYGFTNVKGNWIIMRDDSETNSFRYAKGEKDFPGNWQGRANLKYDYFYNLPN
jgi:hypothetical protein